MDSKIKKISAILFLTACMVLPFAFNASNAYSATPAKETIFKTESVNETSFENVAFTKDESTIKDETDIVVEKVASNPLFNFKTDIRKIYALKTVSVYSSPVKESGQKVETFSKGEQLNAIAYNETTDTYQIKFGNNNEVGYVYGSFVTTDKNMSFEDIKGTYYISEDTSVFDYPSIFDGKPLKELSINDEIKVTGKNGEGFYEVQLENNEKGYVKISFTSDKKIVFENNFDWAHRYPAPTKKIPNNNNLTDIQAKIKSIAMTNGSTEPTAEGYCAAWVSGVYNAAGLGYPGGNAIDYWTQWKNSGDSSMLNIPVGAVVIGSGSSSSAGMTYGHVGIYIGDTDGDGEGEVAENIGYFAITPMSKWISWQTTPVYPTYGGTYGPGFIGWVWPYGKALN